LDGAGVVLFLAGVALAFSLGYSAGTANKVGYGAGEFLEGFKVGRQWKWSKSTDQMEVPAAFTKAMKD